MGLIRELLSDGSTSREGDHIDITIREDISDRSISIDFGPDSEWERRIRDHSSDELAREDDFLRDLPYH